MKTTPIKEGGLFNHFHVFIICALIAPVLIVILAVFGEQIDEYFSIWQRQFIGFMILCGGFGIWWLTWKIRQNHNI